MSRRTAVLLWVVIAVGVWNAVYDPYIERGVRASLQMVAEAELGLAPEPSLREVMAGSSRHGARVATGWALAVLVAGAVTTYARRPRSGGLP